jgi:acetyl-CoA decarbonylase/synthase complex subunit gamma
MRYAVEPGLYAIGQPTPASPVFVSANYKLSFDHLRRALAGIDGWILVLDTRGVNVWCAAGKGTFGTAELVERIRLTHLDEFVSHRELIAPQLGATGVAAHRVREASGFRVLYGPVRARDIPAFLAAGRRATPEMRRVRFDLRDRLAVVPVELGAWGKYTVPVAAALFVLSGLHRGGFSGPSLFGSGSRAAGLVLAALLGGAVLTPAFLPWLPGRAFTVKGATLGAVIAIGAIALGWLPIHAPHQRADAAGWLLMLPAISGFVAMNYTGASTFTSLSGVKREMRYAIPAQITAAAAGLGLWIVARFLR